MPPSAGTLKVNNMMSSLQLGASTRQSTSTVTTKKNSPALYPRKAPCTQKTLTSAARITDTFRTWSKEPVNNPQNMCDTTILSPRPVSTNTYKAPTYIEDISEADNGSSNKTDNKTKTPDYTKEEERLKSYRNWTNLFMRPEKLVKAGFYYLNHDDAVRCAFCNVEGHCWEAEDDPMDDHRKWNPHCPFVRANTTSNQDNDYSCQNQMNRDTCGNFDLYTHSFPEDVTLEHLKSLDIQWTRRCYNIDFKTYEARLASFKNWPISLRQKPDELAKAGFYYVGMGDQVLCYYCGGGLKNWEEMDEPWEQHARWFSKCNYLLSEKGREFIDYVKNKFNNKQKNYSPSTSTQTKEQKQDVTTEFQQKVKDEKGTTTTTTATTTTQLQDEKECADSDRLCKICFKNDVRLVFQPCSHAMACVECGLDIEKCPICRKPILGTVRMFLS